VTHAIDRFRGGVKRQIKDLRRENRKVASNVDLGAPPLVKSGVARLWHGFLAAFVGNDEQESIRSNAAAEVYLASIRTGSRLYGQHRAGARTRVGHGSRFEFLAIALLDLRGWSLTGPGDARGIGRRAQTLAGDRNCNHAAVEQSV
jgi:hypothetical protein